MVPLMMATVLMDGQDKPAKASAVRAPLLNESNRMQHNEHQNLIGLIWNIANKLRGPYRPPQYRKVMLPLIVLRRLDLVLAPTKDKVLESAKAFKAKALKKAEIKLAGPMRKAVLVALSERDPQADICRNSHGEPEADADLRDTEIVPLPPNTKLPLPLGYDNETGHDKLLKLVKGHCENYLKREVLPHVPDAWIDHSKTKVGYEIPLNRHFYVYQPPRALGEIEANIKALESEIMTMLAEVV